MLKIGTSKKLHNLQPKLTMQSLLSDKLVGNARSENPAQIVGLIHDEKLRQGCFTYGFEILCMPTQ